MMLPTSTGLRMASIVLLASTVAFAVSSAMTESQFSYTVDIEVRVWQPVDESRELWDRELWISARQASADWDSPGSLGPLPLTLYRSAGGYAPTSRYVFGDFIFAGVGLRVWQRAVEREHTHVQVCSAACPPRPFAEGRAWGPLGMVPLALIDGRTPDGRYRYGDLTLSIPVGNPGLLADREYLLAMRDALSGDGAELNWSVDRATREWEGITLSRGIAPRVTGLRLSERGLSGEIWGWLGNLTELTSLYLDKNALTGIIPSKVALLGKLRWVYLSGNNFEGCIPPPLRRAEHHDLDSLSLPDCSDPDSVHSLVDPDSFFRPRLTAGSYFVWSWQRRDRSYVTFDVPGGQSLRFEDQTLGDVVCDLGGPLDNLFDAFSCSHESGVVLRRSLDWDIWFAVDMWRNPGAELERSHYSGCVYYCDAGGSPAALLEQLAASIWVNEAVGDDDEWAWP